MSRKKKIASTALNWTHHTPHHWSATLDDSRIDYWPTTRKWRHEGQMHEGDVNAYVANFSNHGAQEVASRFCEMPADIQAQVLKELFRRAPDWSIQWSAIGEYLDEATRRHVVRFFDFVRDAE